MAVGLPGKMLAETIHVNDFFIFADSRGSPGHAPDFEDFLKKPSRSGEIRPFRQENGL
ncbi:hypothetical protein [Azotobacter salinestris]|uniref:hypothetical protein n=1 Tax=Azotobacter salinestris TaxID=69964 RepID=UPI0032DF7CAF